MEEWLNGWPRLGPWEVLVGNAVHCVGCGKYRGIAAIVIHEDYKPPEKLPVWPFHEESCPVCFLVAKLPPATKEDKLTERLLKLRGK